MRTNNMLRIIVLVFVAVFANPTVIAYETGPCILPPYPKHGFYTVEGNSSAMPGDILDSYLLTVTCEDGYRLDGSDNGTSCLQGRYADLPECISNCEWKSEHTVSCGVLQSTCYMNTTTALSRIKADDDLSCDCGQVSPIHLEVIAGGRDAKMYEVPWHAGIYNKCYRPFKQSCGGSLISTTVVISAAHCFWDDVQKQLPAENYAVALGKIYRPWNDPHDEFAQKSDVKEIKIPPRFLGSIANFQQDLAVLVLTDAVHYNRAVRPVCLDFDYTFDVRQLTPGALGKVSGWGLKDQDGKPSPKLQVAQIPYMSIEECVAVADPSFRAYITGDKICAGYTNGTAVCRGDSGGGLVFPLQTARGERYYLRGVVSAAPRSNHECNVYMWTTFTHLLRHQYFIQRVLGETPTATPPTCYSSL